MKLRRTILSAMLSGEIGPLTSDQLLALPKTEWQHLRDAITDNRRGQAKGVEAKCMACGAPVYISCSDVKGEKRPYYAHYNEANQSCPWYRGKNLSPHDARAIQYAGQQESEVHRMLCEKVDELVRLDARYMSSTVDQYLPPKDNSHGRYPDVYFELEGLGQFVIEIQKSNTFQTEISDRIGHYQRENIPIIWVLFGLEAGKDVNQSFSDVIQRHRGNAFVLDQAAIKKSISRQSLHLSCYLLDKNGELEPPVQVSLDQLTVPQNMVPFYQDRIAEPMCAEFRNRRIGLYKAIRSWDIEDQYVVIVDIEIAFSELPVQASLDLAFVKCIATIYSIILDGLQRPEILVTRCHNIKAMINSLCQGHEYARYSALLIEVLKHSHLNYLLQEKVGEHLSRNAKALVLEDSSQWAVASYLFPELLNPLKRKLLSDLGALPVWAVPR
ncbi:hypothetical protein KFE96_04305 [Kordiimonas sp. SCSIO 12603]|uniref:DUF6035 family protein n=1 Tax=Kordiimonas sp. SCSIO 12603 TaxID=2829596 RepID=UPI002106A707|nr:DUF6035 family protein [Kordiimonas sp. SCSIO 12603]UTW59534.1 hypothetical protein KFE96_04305 [Kordiimonas sp. SCSIO 12603]